MLLAPQLLLQMLMIDIAPNIWMQLLGLALSALGYYYIKASKDRNFDFYHGTVPIRIGQFFVVVVLVWAYSGPYILIGVSAIEAIAGIVTWRLIADSK